MSSPHGQAVQPEILAAPVSVFRGIKGTEPLEHLPLVRMLQRIKDGVYCEAVAPVRALYGHNLGEHQSKAYKEAKASLLTFTPCCDMQTRRKDVPLEERVLTLTQLVHYDYDHLDDPGTFRQRIAQNPHCVFAFLSPSGAGVKVGMRSPAMEKVSTYKRTWEALRQYLHATYPDAQDEDTHIKYVHALCYVSDDPAMYVNLEACPWTMPPQATTPSRAARAPLALGAPDYARAASAVDAIPNNDATYDTWLKVGMGLHDTGEPWARALWDDWSQRSQRYKESDQEATWRSFTTGGGTTLGTVFQYAKEAGWRDSRSAAQSRNVNTHQARIIPTMSGALPSPVQGNGQVDEGTEDMGTEADERPVIRIDPLFPLGGMIDAGEQAIAALPGSPHLFQRAGLLVLVTRGAKQPKFLTRDPALSVIRIAPDSYIRELVSQAAQWEKWDARKNRYTPCFPFTDFPAHVKARPSLAFPPLEGLVYSPTLRPDGSVLDTPGYDDATGLFYDPQGVTYPPVLKHPSVEDAQAALKRLKHHVLHDFLFDHDGYRSAALAALLTGANRFAIQGCTPLFSVTASTPGIGKTLLTDAISLVATGHAASRCGYTPNEEEERKRTFALCLEGDSAICIDNVRGPFGSGWMEYLLTTRVVKERVLGVTENRLAPQNALWFITGNNLEYRGDIFRRCAPIVLTTTMERPEERGDFLYTDLPAHLRAARPMLYIDALTVIQAYLRTTEARPTFTSWGSFEAWNTLIRGALLWCNEADPLYGRTDLQEAQDVEHEARVALFKAWYACYPDGTEQTLHVIASDIKRQMAYDRQTPNNWNDFHTALGALDMKFDGDVLHTIRLGNALRRIKGRVIGVLRLSVGKPERNGAVTWKMAPVTDEGQESVPF